MLGVAALGANASTRLAAWLVVVGPVVAIELITSFPVGGAGGVIASVGLTGVALVQRSDVVGLVERAEA